MPPTVSYPKRLIQIHSPNKEGTENLRHILHTCNSDAIDVPINEIPNTKQQTTQLCRCCGFLPFDEVFPLRRADRFNPPPQLCRHQYHTQLRQVHHQPPLSNCRTAKMESNCEHIHYCSIHEHPHHPTRSNIERTPLATKIFPE